MSRGRKGWRKDSPKFIQLFHYIHDSESVETLSPPALRVYLKLLRKYNGKNADDLSLPYSELKEKYVGLASDASCIKAFKELIEHGLIDVKVHGGLRVGLKTKQCNIYAFSERWKSYGKK